MIVLVVIWLDKHGQPTLSALTLPTIAKGKEALTDYYGARLRKGQVLNALIFKPHNCSHCPRMQLVSELSDGIWQDN